MKRARLILEVTATFAVLLVCSVYLWDRSHPLTRLQAAAPPSREAPRRPEPPVPTTAIAIKDAPSRGDSNAKVALIIYSDFQCPFCRRFALDTLPIIDREYVTPGRIRVVFRHAPIEEIHKFAVRAAVAAECARQQGKFWEMHDRLFADQAHLDDAAIADRARAIALDQPRFMACLSAATVDHDRSESRDAGVSGTPAFLIGRIDPNGQVKALKRISGAVPISEFRTALDSVLQAQR